MGENYKDRVYDVVSYNPEWPKQFLVIAEDVKKAFGTDALDIQHIGSTAVPGMDGKPTIDVLVLVENIEVADGHISAMQALGYTNAGQVVRDNSWTIRHLSPHGAMYADGGNIARTLGRSSKEARRSLASNSCGWYGLRARRLLSTSF